MIKEAFFSFFLADLANLRLLASSSFALMQKEPKDQESRIPQPGGLLAFARLGGYLHNLNSIQNLLSILISNLQSNLQGLYHGVVAGKTRGAIGFVLNFWFFLFKQKERREGQKPDQY